MEYKVDSIISSGNGIWNEDALICSHSIFGVIDGVTPVHNLKYQGYNTLTEWMVKNFLHKFDELYILDADYKYICKNFIERMGKDKYIAGLEEYDKPCFTSATVTILNDKIKCEVLGDSYIHIKKKNGDLVEITDDRVDLYAGKTVDVIENAKINNSNTEEAIKNQKIENQKMMNVKGGYWVVAFKGNFESEFIVAEFPIKDIDKILICTDGFQRLQKEFSLLDMKQILDGDISLEDALSMLRNFENANFLKKGYPCVKKSDDAAAIMIKLY